MIVSGTHDKVLVVLSILIAMFASYAALSLAARIRASIGWRRRAWLIAAAVALGGGIWSMHFVAMLAFSMPGMETSYDLALTLLSLGVAVTFTGAGFATMNWRRFSASRIALAGLLMGSGVVAMHYLGMAAMRMHATLHYERRWLAASILIAIGAATSAVWLASRDQKPAHRLIAAVAMGCAIAGMHYAGMRAAIFTAASIVGAPSGEASLGQTYLAALVTAITILILLLVLGGARLQELFRRLERREARTALRLKIADVLRVRDTGQALDEVAALMGAHFRVARAGYGKLDPLEDQFDYDVCWTDGSVAPLLGRHPAATFGRKIVAALSAGETVVVDDLLAAGHGDDRPTRDTAREVDTRAILVVPFVRDGRLRTIVYLNDRAPRVWRRDEITFLEELAERTRLVIERAAVEQQLRELNATLEARVEARTIELREAQEALLQGQKMEAIGQLVSGLAHDFNNVLGAVVGALDLLRHRADDPARVRRLAEAGLEAAERGAKLTGQLLAFSRSQRIELRPIVICDVIAGLRELLSRTLGPMIALEFRPNPAPVAVLADATQVEMMILNLAINARDAMPDGGELHIATAIRAVTCDKELADGDYVEVTVRDTGVGMDEATRRRAMEPFFTTKPVGKGTGLGLAQIYGSARQAGGTVRIESVPQVGTTVRVLLRCTDERPPRRAEAAAEPREHASRPANILLVDDDDDLRDIVATALRTAGHSVQEASDGADALAKLTGGSPDLAILDFAMPGMNGAELARAIGERLPDLPLLFASGYSDTAAIEAACGGRAMTLRKPFRVDQLLAAVDGALYSGAPSDRSAAGTPSNMS